MKKGVTLTEILIVISLLVFLAILGSVYLRSQIFKGNDAKRKADMRRIGLAAEEYEKDNDCYPLPSLLSCNPGTGLSPYLDKIPCDPVNGNSYFYEHEDSICPSWFRIYTFLENENDSDITQSIGPGQTFNYAYQSSNAPYLDSGEGGGGEAPQLEYYGCFSGSCAPITWDSGRPGPECDPNYQNATCYGECSNPANECEDWN